MDGATTDSTIACTSTECHSPFKQRQEQRIKAHFLHVPWHDRESQESKEVYGTVSESLRWTCWNSGTYNDLILWRWCMFILCTCTCIIVSTVPMIDAMPLTFMNTTIGGFSGCCV